MSARVKLAGKLPGDDPVNGIDYLAEPLCDRWSERDPDNPASVLIIGVARVRKFETVDTGDGVHRVPTVEISRLEVLGALGREGLTETLPNGSSRLVLGLADTSAQQLLLNVAEARTGSAALPIDAESELDHHQVLED